VTTKYLAKFQSPMAVSWPKILIELIFGMIVYNNKLQINFKIHSSWRIFGQLIAVGLWNLAKYLVVTTFFIPSPTKLRRDIVMLPSVLLPKIKSISQIIVNKGNAKRGVSPRLKIWPGDLDLLTYDLENQ
jgi:hypothetical protein